MSGDTRAMVEFTFAGQSLRARAGDTIAMALWAADRLVLRHSSDRQEARGVFCNMGVCYECLVLADGATVRACTTVVRDGMRVLRGGPA